MTAPNYPNPPATGEIKTVGTTTFQYDGEKWRAKTSADPTLRAELAAVGSEVLIAGLPAYEIVNALAGESITLESISEDAGTGGDDTDAWAAACALSVSTGRGILLLSKTYRIRSQREDELKWTFKSHLKGVGDAKIIALNQEQKQPEGNYKMVLPLEVDNVTISDFQIDGNISADPANWATGYNAFAGSRSLVLWNSTGVTIERITANNTIQAGVAVYVGEDISVDGCKTNRTRGNFGDGFYFMGVVGLTVTNCKAYDMTRIGFVLESNTSVTISSRSNLFLNCIAEYGHDSSNLYGGIESNFGFWYENFVNATTINCRAKNMSRISGGGFKSVPSFWPAHAPNNVGMLYVNNSYINCVAENVRYGFSVDSIQPQIRNMCKISSCSAIGVQIGLYIGSRTSQPVDPYLQKNEISVDDFYIYIDEYAVAARGIMQLGGNITAEKVRIKYDSTFNQVEWDSELNGYSAIGAFGSDSGDFGHFKDVKIFLDDDTEIPINIKYRSNQTRELMNLVVEDCTVKTVTMNCRNIQYINCTIPLIGTEEAKESLRYDECLILDSKDNTRPVTCYQTSVEPVTFADCTFDYTASQNHLYIYIGAGRISEDPAFIFHRCKFKKDFEADSYIIRFNADTDLKNNNNEIFNAEVSNCTFLNAGGSTTNPIAFTDGVLADKFTLYGPGNFKSNTLLVDGNSTLQALY